jgi:hypothetical protein
VERIKKLKAAGQNVSLKIYPGTNHGWINKFADTFLPNARHFNKCGLGWIDDDGFTYGLDGAVTTRDMDWGTFIRKLAGTCGERGTTIKYQEVAFNDTLIKTVKIFTRNLKCYFQTDFNKISAENVSRNFARLRVKSVEFTFPNLNGFVPIDHLPQEDPAPTGYLTCYG